MSNQDSRVESVAQWLWNYWNNSDTRKPRLEWGDERLTEFFPAYRRDAQALLNLIDSVTEND